MEKFRKESSGSFFSLSLSHPFQVAYSRTLFDMWEDQWLVQARSYVVKSETNLDQVSPSSLSWALLYKFLLPWRLFFCRRPLFTVEKRLFSSSFLSSFLFSFGSFFLFLCSAGHRHRCRATRRVTLCLSVCRVLWTTQVRPHEKEKERN